MNRRWLSTDRSSRSSIASKVSARSFSSSPGPASAIRSCRLDSDSRRAVAVMRCSGRSSRPDSHQPASTDTSVSTAIVTAVTVHW
jgi:hypothetical protein